MKYLKEFNQYIIERSKNDPIPELYSNDKLALFLMGTPASGKSTFIKSFIKPRKNIKVFSSDDISLLFTKDPNIRYRGAGELNIKRIDVFMDGGESFIYDTTPTYTEDKVNLITKAKEYGYKIIFISLMTPLDIALKRNMERDRHTSEEFLIHIYNTFWNKMVQHKDLQPDVFYIVTDVNNKYTYYKYNYDFTTLQKRKVDRYV